ncbi:MAG: UDP-N-acetylglucosamine 2-epimerase [bacterium]|nr:UDP-N-acetylglucosamine 2-epimerase [bacterium]
MYKKKICFFTSTRADYGILRPLIKKIKNDKNFSLQIIASGMHLSPEFGLTYKEIEKDNFKIDKKIEILLSSDTSIGISKAMGLGIISFSEALDNLKPDIVIVLGDRFETLAFAIASYILKIPIAHLYGGEFTFGAIDEAFRHCITKLSFLHFTSLEYYRQRIIQLGEEPNRVFTVGALGIDNIKNMKLLSRKEVEKYLGKKFKKKNLLITFHPVTLEKDTTEYQLGELLKALDELENTLLIFTKSNADPSGRIINEIIEEYYEKNKEKVVLFTNMGQLLYLSTMKYVDAVVGNSSSGIIEAPSFKIGTINIGDRQKGRVKPESVIDCEPNYKSIKNAITKLYSNEFQNILKKVINPYGDGNAADRILNILKEFNPESLKKEFYVLKNL